jgi:hypothetical protein
MRIALREAGNNGKQKHPLNQSLRAMLTILDVEVLASVSSTRSLVMAQMCRLSQTPHLRMNINSE